jgi:hypothetical protein
MFTAAVAGDALLPVAMEGRFSLPAKSLTL